MVIDAFKGTWSESPSQRYTAMGRARVLRQRAEPKFWKVVAGICLSLLAAVDAQKTLPKDRQSQSSL